MKATPSDIAAGTSRLLENGWLSRTPSDFQAALLSGIVWRNLEPGEPIMFGGDVEGGLFGVASGSCHFLAAEGLPDLPAIHIGRSGTWMGMAPVVKATARMATAVVRSPALIAHLPQSAFNAMIAERPERWPIFSLILVEVTAKSFQAVADLMIPDSRRRLIAVLLRAADVRNEGDGPAQTDIGQGELAAMSNLARQTTGEILRRMADQKLVTLGYRSIEIHDPAALRDILFD